MQSFGTNVKARSVCLLLRFLDRCARFFCLSHSPLIREESDPTNGFRNIVGMFLKTSVGRLAPDRKFPTPRHNCAFWSSLCKCRFASKTHFKSFRGSKFYAGIRPNQRNIASARCELH